MKAEWIVLHHYVNDNDLPLLKQHQLAERVKSKKLSYHYIVFSDGSYWMINDPRKPIGHCGADFVHLSKNRKTSNFNSIAVCCMGNFQRGKMGEPQKTGLIKLIFKLCCKLGIKTENITRHSDVWKTACPGRYYPFSDVVVGVKKMFSGRLVFTIGENKIQKGETILQSTKSPEILWGVAIFPVRELLINLGYQVNWVADENKIVATSSSSAVNLWVDKKNILVDGTPRILDFEVLNIWGTTTAPLRSLLENLGYKVTWNSESKTIEANKMF